MTLISIGERVYVCFPCCFGMRNPPPKEVFPNHLVKSMNIFFSFFLFLRTACAFCYYGVVLMTTELFESSCVDHASMPDHIDCTADCKELSTQDYVDLLWTTIAEFPG